MKIEVGDYVMYHSIAINEGRKPWPVVNLILIKVTKVGLEGTCFEDKDGNLYDHFRVRHLFRNDKKSIEYDGYDGVRCVQEDDDNLNKET